MAQSKKPSPTDHLVRAVLDAPDHRIKVDFHEVDRYEHLIRAAHRFKKTPEGKQLRLERNWQEHVAWVVLEDIPAWRMAVLDPIAVPQQLRKPSDVVVELRGRDDFRIRQTEKTRALRLVEALVREARSRGYTVRATPALPRDRWGYRQYVKDHGHLEIEIERDTFRLTVGQKQERVSRTPSQADQDRGWSGPSYDTVPSPRLLIKIEGQAAAFWNSEWADTTSTSLDDSLAQILQELELRQHQAKEKREEERRRLIERRKEWEIARERAIELLTESHWANVLEHQIERWELVARIAAYAEAVEAWLDQHPDLRDEAEPWLAWMRAYARRIDPLPHELQMPPTPAPTPDRLAPFMKGWSPYGLD